MIKLSAEEFVQAGETALGRAVSSHWRGSDPAWEFEEPTDVVKQHLKGALGERAVAKALDREWNYPVDVFRSEADLPGDPAVEVRSGYEKVKEDDVGDVVVFVEIHKVDRIRIKGWYPLEEAKREDWKRNPGGRGECYKVPNDEIKSMEEFPR